MDKASLEFFKVLVDLYFEEKDGKRKGILWGCLIKFISNQVYPPIIRRVV